MKNLVRMMDFMDFFLGSVSKGWDRLYIITQLAVYTTYIPLIVLAFVWGLYNPYHPLQEPEKSIE